MAMLDKETSLLAEKYVKEEFAKSISRRHPSKSFQFFNLHKFSMFDLAMVEDGQLVGFVEIKCRDKHYETTLVKYGKYLMASVIFNMLKIKCYLLNFTITNGELFMVNLLDLHHKGQFKTTGDDSKEDYAYYELNRSDIFDKIEPFKIGETNEV